MQTVKSNGFEIPALGFGVFRMSDEEIAKVIPAALEAGFRHFDSAQIYKNEAALGKALEQTGVSRDEIFLTTKVWADQYAPEKFAASVGESLEKLRVNNADLLLLHWPGDEVTVAEQVAMLNEVRAAGKTRLIGVSNQKASQMRKSVEYSAAPIVTNQIEVHPYLNQSAVARAAAELDVAITGYYGMADGAVTNDPLLQKIGAQYGKTAAQAALRWVIQQGFIALSKTANPARAAENAAIFDFTLSDEDMDAIHGLARPDGRIVSPENLSPVWDA